MKLLLLTFDDYKKNPSVWLHMLWQGSLQWKMIISSVPSFKIDIKCCTVLEGRVFLSCGNRCDVVENCSRLPHVVKTNDHHGCTSMQIVALSFGIVFLLCVPPRSSVRPPSVILPRHVRPSARLFVSRIGPPFRPSIRGSVHHPTVYPLSFRPSALDPPQSVRPTARAGAC